MFIKDKLDNHFRPEILKSAAKFRYVENGRISSLSIHENYIFFVGQDKYVRRNRSNIEFPFIKALECVLLDFKATRLKLPPVC